MPGKYPAAVESLGLIASVRLSFEGRALPGIGSGAKKANSSELRNSYAATNTITFNYLANYLVSNQVVFVALSTQEDRQ